MQRRIEGMYVGHYQVDDAIIAFGLLGIRVTPRYTLAAGAEMMGSEAATEAQRSVVRLLIRHIPTGRESIWARLLDQRLFELEREHAATQTS